MGSETSLKLPVIDLRKPNLKPGTSEWETVKGQVLKALEEFGCFEALYDKIPEEQREGIFEAMKEAFDLPLEAKRRNTSKLIGHGYNTLVRDDIATYETMGFEDAEIIEEAEALTKALWPQGNPSFCKAINSFSKELIVFDQMIRRMILEGFNLDKYMDEHMNSTYNFFRAMKYGGPRTSDKQLGLKSHTDTGTLSILCQNEVEGLQIQTQDGQWIDVKPSSNDTSKHTYIVMMAESFTAWLNGRLPSPHHRVVMSGDKARLSVGMFSLPKKGYITKPVEELVDEQHPLQFKPSDYSEFMDFYATMEGQTAQFPFKTYCGISY